MNPLTADEAVRIFPDLQHLRLLDQAGWKWLPVEESQLAEAILDGYRIWPHGWRDCIRVKTLTEVLGLRMHISADEHVGNEIVWEDTGSLEEIVGEFLAMPAPESRTAPNIVIGSAPQLWTP